MCHQLVSVTAMFVCMYKQSGSLMAQRSCMATQSPPASGPVAAYGMAEPHLLSTDLFDGFLSASATQANLQRQQNLRRSSQAAIGT